MRLHKNIPLSLVVGLGSLSILTMIGSFESVQAGEVVIVDIYEEKNFLALAPGTYEVPSVNNIICFDICTDRIKNVRIHNREKITVSGPDFTAGFKKYYNVYPMFFGIVQPVVPGQKIDLFSILAGDTGTGIGSLPSGTILESANVIGVNTGNAYNSEVTLINDLNNLPNSSSNNTNIAWDLSGFSTITGNFYLAKTTIPLEDICPIPEPTSTLSLLALGTLGAASTLKRKLKSTKSTGKETTKVG